MSLRVALNELGLGPCHHMKWVIDDLATQVPAWEDILQGKWDWMTVYQGQHSAVDWPTASFYEQLSVAFPDAKFILTYRSPESWADSISETILTALAGVNEVPPEIQRWMKMCIDVIALAGVHLDMNKAQLIDAFEHHNERVKQTIPDDRLLVYQVKEGWEPLCQFLNVPVPNTAFPRTNDREEFFRLVNGEAN